MTVAHQKYGGIKMNVLDILVIIAFLILVFLKFLSRNKEITINKYEDTVIEFRGGRIIEVHK